MVGGEKNGFARRKFPPPISRPWLWTKELDGVISFPFKTTQQKQKTPLDEEEKREENAPSYLVSQDTEQMPPNYSRAFAKPIPLLG